PQIDVNRSQVEVLTRQQRLVSLQNDVSKQKINLARLTGLPPNDQYDISDDVPFAAAPAVSLEDAVKQAIDQRADLKAAEVQVRAAEHALTAATGRAGRPKKPSRKRCAQRVFGFAGSLEPSASRSTESGGNTTDPGAGAAAFGGRCEQRGGGYASTGISGQRGAGLYQQRLC